MKRRAKVLQIDRNRSVNSQDARIWEKCAQFLNNKSKRYKRNFIECPTFIRLNILLRTLQDNLRILTLHHLYVSHFTMRCKRFHPRRGTVDHHKIHLRKGGEPRFYSWHLWLNMLRLCRLQYGYQA